MKIKVNFLCFFAHKIKKNQQIQSALGHIYATLYGTGTITMFFLLRTFDLRKQLFRQLGNWCHVKPAQDVTMFNIRA